MGEKPIVDWSKMPAWANFVARTKLKYWMWFENEPNISELSGIFYKVSGEYGYIPEPYIPTYEGDWIDSLVQRP